MEYFAANMTVASVLEIDPLAAQVLFRYGIRAFFSPVITNQTIAQLSEVYGFNLRQALDDLNKLTLKNSNLFMGS